MPDLERAQLLARRIPANEVIAGRAYVIHARNGGVGVAVDQEGRLGYRLHREKHGRHYLFVEWDWGEGPPHGTAIPLRLLEAPPPQGEEALLTWLSQREAEHEDEIERAWASVLGASRST